MYSKKAERHLEVAIFHLQFLRKEYVRVKRENGMFTREDLELIKEEMAEAKERIAKFQRIVL